MSVRGSKSPMAIGVTYDRYRDRGTRGTRGTRGRNKTNKQTTKHLAR